ncbi:unnamed protein product [Nesidiocoris tenuis]|uniref:Uncharacterized protein n=1 Tax=Nesidiocoris tenuis TaxID=355587 RepID=A0A6H5HAS5_9HEMI|nr:unnamed protein product [Nesidiocoris tenuis]
MKENFLAGSSSQFLDIDGNESVALDRPVDLAPKDTSHKIKRHLSLYDLTQLPQSTKVNRPQISSKPGKKSECHHSGDADRSISSANKRGQLTLPKGSEQLDQPYVVPKFMPSFREIMMESKKENPMVSITESTPPSLQKWAVEWNSEPKSLSISELQEDLLREAEENNLRRESKRRLVGRSFSEGRRYFENKNSFEGMLQSDETKKAHDRQRWQTVSETVNPPRGVVFNASDRSGISDLGKFGKLKNISDGFKKYSFAETISRKDPNSPVNRGYSDSIPRIFKQNSHVYDEDEQEFYEWFKHKLSKASEFSRQTGQNSSNSVKSTRTMSNYEGPRAIGDTEKAAPPQDETSEKRFSENTPDVYDRPAPITKLSASEKNSSFYQWLSSRICIPVDRSNWRAKAKGETNGDETGDLKPSKYPWSCSYPRKPVSYTEESSQPLNGNFDEFLNEPSSANATAFYRKVKSQMTLKRPKLTRVRKAKSLVGVRPLTANRQNRKETEKDDNRPRVLLKKSVPYSQWTVNSELDHIRHLRGLELKDGSVKASNVENLGDRQQSGSSPPLKFSNDSIRYKKQPCGSWWCAKESVSPYLGKNPDTSSVHDNDFIGFSSISDDPVSTMDFLLNSQPNDDTDYKASEHNEEEYDNENCAESSKYCSDTPNSLWCINQGETNYRNDGSKEHGLHQDSNDSKKIADEVRLKFQKDIQNEEAATDAEWNRAVGPRSVWPNDDDLIRRLGGEVTKIDLFSLSCHSRPF